MSEFNKEYPLAECSMLPVSMAEQAGFKVVYRQENGYNYHRRFEKGGKHIWAIKKGWQVADFIDGKHVNHTPQSNLREAIECKTRKLTPIRRGWIK